MIHIGEALMTVVMATMLVLKNYGELGLGWQCNGMMVVIEMDQ